MPTSTSQLALVCAYGFEIIQSVINQQKQDEFQKKPDEFQN